MPPEGQTPYLSVVVCSRNDDHGGALIPRMQAFLDNLSMQSEKFKLPTELIVVEWNPPEDRQRLTSALSLPDDNPFLDWSVIEVPNSIHRTLEHSDSLPLFQMIAKNVGIRRARGSFVLATNIDILFPDELMEFLATRPLEAGKVYRIARYDVPYDTATGRSPGEQLAFAEGHVVRMNTKEYTLEPGTGRILWIYFRWRGLRQMQTILWYTGPLPAVNFLAHQYSDDLERFAARRRFRSKRRLGGWWRRYLDRVYASLLPVVEARDKVGRIGFDLFAAPPPNLPMLFSNTSGDFTLMSREDWFKLRGYAEFQQYSLHIDSILLYAAYFEGMEEVVLEGNVYHIDHSMGWSPLTEGGRSFGGKMKGVPVLSYVQFLEIVEGMKSSPERRIVNDGEWGLEGAPLVVTERRARPSTMAD